MQSTSYITRRNELETYFDKTAADAWAKLTSDAPVSGVRATVRAGRDAMRANILARLPADLSGRRVLDAGCGAGQLAVEAARRGADVVAVDLSESLLSLARSRYAQEPLAGRIEFLAGDMFDPALGQFDHVVAMDSLIHYEASDMTGVIAGFAARAAQSVIFTFAPKTALLTLMHAAGKFFPRGDRAPAIAPVSEKELRARLSHDAALADWRIAGSDPVKSGFYMSTAMELARA